MPIRPDQPLVPSVLDRLMDDDPGVTSEPPRNRSLMLREMKLAVRRDIENLLNSPDQNGLLNDVLDQSNQAVDAGLNDVFIPSVPTQPFDFSGFSFPFNYIDQGSGAGTADQALQTSYDDSSWAVS